MKELFGKFVLPINLSQFKQFNNTLFTTIRFTTKQQAITSQNIEGQL